MSKIKDIKLSDESLQQLAKTTGKTPSELAASMDAFNAHRRDRIKKPLRKSQSDAYKRIKRELAQCSNEPITYQDILFIRRYRNAVSQGMAQGIKFDMYVFRLSYEDVGKYLYNEKTLCMGISKVAVQKRLARSLSTFEVCQFRNAINYAFNEKYEFRGLSYADISPECLRGMNRQRPKLPDNWIDEAERLRNEDNKLYEQQQSNMQLWQEAQQERKAKRRRIKQWLRDKKNLES